VFAKVFEAKVDRRDVPKLDGLGVIVDDARALNTTAGV